MMHGHEKSDSVIVAVKPANKAAHPAVEQSASEPVAAEPVEPRAETKRNAGQQSTCGTQGQVSVSQALERIRRVAKERKKEKFTSLLHHISIDLLDEAFFELKEEAGRTGRRWSDVDGIRAEPRSQYRGPACSRSSGSISGTAVTARVHTQA